MNSSYQVVGGILSLSPLLLYNHSFEVSLPHIIEVPRDGRDQREKFRYPRDLPKEGGDPVEANVQWNTWDKPGPSLHPCHGQRIVTSQIAITEHLRPATKTEKQPKVSQVLEPFRGIRTQYRS